MTRLHPSMSQPAAFHLWRTFSVMIYRFCSLHGNFHTSNMLENANSFFKNLDTPTHFSSKLPAEFLPSRSQSTVFILRNVTKIDNLGTAPFIGNLKSQFCRKVRTCVLRFDIQTKLLVRYLPTMSMSMFSPKMIKSVISINKCRHSNS